MCTLKVFIANFSPTCIRYAYRDRLTDVLVCLLTCDKKGFSFKII